MEKIEPLNTVETVEKLDIVSLDYNTLKKPELIELIKTKDAALENYTHKIETMEVNHNQELNDMNNYYSSKIKELQSIIDYHMRKENIIKGLLNIETGGER